MVKYWKEMFGVVVVCCMFCAIIGCSNREKHTKGFQEPDKISVVTTIYPMYDFVTKIAGDKAEVVNLVPAGMEPHDFELSTGDMLLVESADIFIYNGADMEHFVDKTLESVSNKDLVVVEAAKDVNTLESGDKTDPHTWLSIENAIIEAETIKKAFAESDRENAEFYESNFESYKKQLEELGELYQKELSDVSQDTIVVAHEAFGYLCAEYGLKQEAVEGLTADSEPDSARMKEIIDFCKDKSIRVIFFEELVSPKVANAIAEEVGAKAMVLNPIEGLTAAQQEEGLDYIGLMKENLKALKTALE